MKPPDRRGEFRQSEHRRSRLGNDGENADGTGSDALRALRHIQVMPATIDVVTAASLGENDAGDGRVSRRE